MQLTLKDLDRLQKNGVGGFTTAEEQRALIELAREGLKAVQHRLQSDGERWCPVKGCANNYESKCVIGECSIPRR